MDVRQQIINCTSLQFSGVLSAQYIDRINSDLEKILVFGMILSICHVNNLRK